MRDDTLAGAEPSRDGVVVISSNRRFDRTFFEHAVVLRDIDHSLFSRIQHSRTRHRENIVSERRLKPNLHEHSRPQAHLRIGNLDPRCHRSILRIDGRLKEINGTFDGTAPKSRGGDLHLLSGANQRNVGFKNARLHPYRGKVHQFEQDIALFHILPIGNVAFGNHTGNR